MKYEKIEEVKLLERKKEGNVKLRRQAFRVQCLRDLRNILFNKASGFIQKFKIYAREITRDE